MMATTSSSLPPSVFATSPAMINMIRQTGIPLGVAIPVAVLGAANGSGGAELLAFRHGWCVTAALAPVGTSLALGLLNRPSPSSVLPDRSGTGSTRGTREC
jgi:hypothetical protein